MKTHLKIKHSTADALSLLPIEKSDESEVDENILVIYFDDDDDTRLIIKSEDSNMNIEEFLESKVSPKEDFKKKICTIVAGKNESCITGRFMTYQQEDRFWKKVAATVVVLSSEYSFNKSGLPVRFTFIDRSIEGDELGERRRHLLRLP